MFRFTEQLTKISFLGCGDCQECCSGQRFVIAPLILEDFKIVFGKFPIYFSYIDNELKVFMVLSNGEESCIYSEQGKCSIYEQRPPACQTYPLTPYFDKILCDISCPAVQTKNDFIQGTDFLKNGEIQEVFYPKRFENFSIKYEETQKWLQKIEPLLEQSSLGIKGLKLLTYPKTGMKDKYILMHLESLKNSHIFNIKAIL